MKRGEITPRTAATQRSSLKTLTSILSDRPADALNRAIIDRWLEAIAVHTPKTRYCERVIVANFCRWLVAEGHIPFDPTAGLPRARMPRTLPKVPRTDSVSNLIDHLADDPCLLAVVWVMVGVGLRCIDTSNLDLDDYDADRLTLRVKGKGGHERVLPVPADAAGALDKWIVVRGYKPGALFVGPRRRNRLSAHRLSYLVARAMREAGVHQPHDGKAAHSLRRKAATDVLENSRDLRVVQQMLGHTSLATTQVYLGVVDLDRLRDAMEGRHYIRGPTDVRRSLRGTARSGAQSPGAGSPTKQEKRQQAG